MIQVIAGLVLAVVGLIVYVWINHKYSAQTVDGDIVRINKAEALENQRIKEELDNAKEHAKQANPIDLLDELHRELHEKPAN